MMTNHSAGWMGDDYGDFGRGDRNRQPEQSAGLALFTEAQTTAVSLDDAQARPQSQSEASKASGRNEWVENSGADDGRNPASVVLDFEHDGAGFGERAQHDDTVRLHFPAAQA